MVILYPSTFYSYENFLFHKCRKIGIAVLNLTAGAPNQFGIAVPNLTAGAPNQFGIAVPNLTAGHPNQFGIAV